MNTKASPPSVPPRLPLRMTLMDHPHHTMVATVRNLRPLFQKQRRCTSPDHSLSLQPQG